MVEAFEEALANSSLERSQIEAAWLGSALDDVNVGNSALPLATALRLQNIPVTRVENMCATGTEALRGAIYSVAAGACDVAIALGVEKLKDTGYGGLPLLHQRLSERSVDAVWLRSGLLRAIGRRLCRASWHQGRGSQACYGARLLEKPSERRAEPESTSAQAGLHGNDPRRADDCRSARPFRLLWSVGWCGLCHRDDAGRRAGTGKKRSRDHQSYPDQRQ